MARLKQSARKGGAVSPPNPWDPVVRITHWGVALAIVANGLMNKAGGVAHVWIGWGVLALLLLRFGWGLVGTPEARFSAFPPDPAAAFHHLGDLLRRRPREHASHNPAGALMVYALWALLSVVIATGIMMTEGKSPVLIAEEKAAVAAGDWSVLVKENDEEAEQDEGRDSDRAVKEVHEIAANLILLLALVHIGGVVVESRALRRNLVRPMLMGQVGQKKTSAEP